MSRSLRAATAVAALLVSVVASAEDPESLKEKCLRNGGEWGKWGVLDSLNDIHSCVPRTKDGGKACRNHADCEYLCLSRKELPIGTATVGECAALRTSFGCHTHVDSGKIVGRVCVD